MKLQGTHNPQLESRLPGRPALRGVCSPDAQALISRAGPGISRAVAGRKEVPQSVGTRVIFNDVRYVKTTSETSPSVRAERSLLLRTSVPIRKILPVPAVQPRLPGPDVLAWGSRPRSATKLSFISCFSLYAHPLQPLYFHTLSRLSHHLQLITTAWASVASTSMTVQKAN